MASGLLAKLAEAIGLNLFADGVSNTRQGQQFQQEYVDPFMQKGADFFNQIIPSAAAAETPAPVVDRSRPAPSIDQVFANPPAYNPRPSSALPAGRSTPMMPGLTEPYYPGGTTTLPPSPGIATDDVSAQGINQDMAGFAKTATPMSEYIQSDKTAPVTPEEVDEVIQQASMRTQQLESDPEYGAYLSSLVSEQGLNSPEAREFSINKTLGNIWDATFGDEEWRLRKLMVINSMRLNPQSELTQAFASRIKDLRRQKGANAMADRLEKQDAEKYSTLITGLRNGDLEAKDVISTVYKSPTSMEQKFTLFTEKPETAKKMAEYGLFGAPPTQAKEWDKGQVKYVQDAASEYRAAGQGAMNLQNQLNRFAMQIAQMPEGTGPTQETLAQLTELAAKVGMPVDTAKITNAQSLAAASGMLVAEQLRLNKGPQTDFDARFTGTFFPSMGLTTEANNKIIDYLTSVNRINTYKASKASALLAQDPASGIKGLIELDEMTYNFPAVMQNSSGQWVTFNSYMNNPALKGKSEQEKIDGWLDAYKKASNQ